MKLEIESMTAFYTQDGFTVKAYYQGRDWQVLTSEGKERWFTAWSGELKKSLIRAVQSTVEQEQHATFNPENLVVC